ncbi:TM2 domain-containing protein [Arthrobacter sp. I2-34]|uniref:TM2 domain-containing protein n=1 Tax=Arthrobacter hankyongi TaxID=2904801 RepID=A0ABS9LEK2_9MICC|nr:TM2 domain-containing protein [Arthrobacter hankyongi]MCG2624884.1 TM2 domain-containing protein [Arthrobacter hankyongi]
MDDSDGGRAAGGIASEPHRQQPPFDVVRLSAVLRQALPGTPAGPPPALPSVRPGVLPVPRNLERTRTAVPRPPKAEEYGPFPVDMPVLKDFRTNWVLSLFLGMLGVDRFHRGRPVTGTLKLLTLGGAGLWWAGDLLAVATGYAVDGGGHPMKGRRSHRLLAVVVSLAVILGAGAAAVTAVAPLARPLAVGAGRTTLSVLTALFPAPQRVWVWEEAATLSRNGDGPSTAFLVTGDTLRISYTLNAAGFLYLLPAGANELPHFTPPVIAAMKPETGEVTVAAVPGTYRLYAQSSGRWTARVAEQVLRQP